MRMETERQSGRSQHNGGARSCIRTCYLDAFATESSKSSILELLLRDSCFFLHDECSVLALKSSIMSLLAMDSFTPGDFFFFTYKSIPQHFHELKGFSEVKKNFIPRLNIVILHQNVSPLCIARSVVFLFLFFLLPQILIFGSRLKDLALIRN